MCRWLAYSGAPVALGKLILEPEHSLIDQSLSARWSESTTNADGFGIGWYDDTGTPGLYRHTQPAWSDLNLRDLCVHIRSALFLAHVRSATANLGIQQSNCHPFRHGRWLLVHNGEIRGYRKIRRELAMGVAPELFADVMGTTDSELMLHLALTFGMEDDVLGGVARMVGFVEDVGCSNGIEHPVQMTLGITDGERLHAFRYSSEGASRTLFLSRTIAALRDIAPRDMQGHLEGFSDDARAIVSEPLNELSQPWMEIPESSYVVVEKGEATRVPFEPRE